MTTIERNQIRNLIPDLLSTDHVSLNSKRINFIYGQGVVIYDKTFAVEVYVPKNSREEMTFFAIQRHFGKVDHLGEYYRRMEVQAYDDRRTTNEMKRQFEEALFQHMSLEIAQKNCTVSPLPTNDGSNDRPIMEMEINERINKVA